MELDFYVVGDNAEILPFAFAHAEISALEGKAALEYACAIFFFEAEGRSDFLGIALDGEISGDLVLAVTQRLYLAGTERRQRVAGHGQPFILFEFRIGFVVASV